MKIQEQYDFSRPSPSGQPGFEILEIPGQQAWCFQGNDVQGNPALFSQTYRSEESAQRGLKTAINLLRKKSGYVKETPEGWQIFLLAGNHQELARSLPLSDEIAAKKVLQFFQRVAASQNPVVEAKQAPAAPANPPAAAEEEEELPIRHAFRLYFYAASKEGPLTGRIEHVGNPSESATFKGLNDRAIIEFLRQQLKEGAAAPQAAPAKPAQPAAAAPAKTASIPPLSTLTVKGQSAGDGKSFELVLAATDAPGESAVENCSISLRNMGTRQITVLSNLPAEQTAANTFKIRLATGQLAAGTYHVQASVWVQKKSAAQQTNGSNALQCLNATGWLQLV